MKIDLSKLDRWLDCNNMEAHVERQAVSITLWAGDAPSHRVTREREKDEPEDVSILEACNMMANDCGIPKPIASTQQ